MFCAGLAFACLSAAIKECAGEGTGVSLAILSRGIVGFLSCVAYAGWTRRSLRVRNTRALASRCLTGVAAMYCYYWAFTKGGTDLASAVVLLKTAPVWVALAAPFLLGERSSRWVWAALAIGVGGVALRQGASFEAERAGLLASLAAGVLAAAAYLSLRSLGRSDDTLPVVTWFSLSLIVLPLLGAFGEASKPLAQLSARAWWLLALIGVLGTIGQVFLTAAYKAGRAAAVTLGGLSEVGIALAFSVFWFDQVPTAAALVGSALALASGVVASLGRPPPEDSEPPKVAS